MKRILVSRKAGDLYDVFYDEYFDPCVRWSKVIKIANQFEADQIVVDQIAYRPVGQTTTYVTTRNEKFARP